MSWNFNPQWGCLDRMDASYLNTPFTFGGQYPMGPGLGAGPYRQMSNYGRRPLLHQPSMHRQPLPLPRPRFSHVHGWRRDPLNGYSQAAWDAVGPTTGTYFNHWNGPRAAYQHEQSGYFAGHGMSLQHSYSNQLAQNSYFTDDTLPAENYFAEEQLPGPSAPPWQSMEPAGPRRRRHARKMVRNDIPYSRKQEIVPRCQNVSLQLQQMGPTTQLLMINWKTERELSAMCVAVYDDVSLQSVVWMDSAGKHDFMLFGNSAVRIQVFGLGPVGRTVDSFAVFISGHCTLQTSQDKWKVLSLKSRICDRGLMDAMVMKESFRIGHKKLDESFYKLFPAKPDLHDEEGATVDLNEDAVSKDHSESVVVLSEVDSSSVNSISSDCSVQVLDETGFETPSVPEDEYLAIVKSGCDAKVSTPVSVKAADKKLVLEIIDSDQSVISVRSDVSDTSVVSVTDSSVNTILDNTLIELDTTGYAETMSTDHKNGICESSSSLSCKAKSNEGSKSQKNGGASLKENTTLENTLVELDTTGYADQTFVEVVTDTNSNCNAVAEYRDQCLEISSKLPSPIKETDLSADLKDDLSPISNGTSLYSATRKNTSPNKLKEDSSLEGDLGSEDDGKSIYLDTTQEILQEKLVKTLQTEGSYEAPSKKARLMNEKTTLTFSAPTDSVTEDTKPGQKRTLSQTDIRESDPTTSDKPKERKILKAQRKLPNQALPIQETLVQDEALTRKLAGRQALLLMYFKRSGKVYFIRKVIGSSGFHIPFSLVASEQYEARLFIFEDEKHSSPTGYTVQAVSSFLTFTTLMTPKHLESLQRLAEVFINTASPRYHPLKFFYRNKPLPYFDNIFENHNGVMKPYMKDYNGDQGSPINGQLNGLFFSAAVSYQNGKIPSSSCFGGRRLHIPVNILFGKDTCLYFSDFYCTTKNGPHYVTLVMTRKNSKADVFCQPRLRLLNPLNNPFLYKQKHNNGWQVYTCTCVTTLHIEVFYTEDVDIKKLTTMYKNQVTFQNVCTFGRGHSSVRGIPKYLKCPICNLQMQYIISADMK